MEKKKDDAKYIALIDKYKTHRMDLGEKANMYLEAAAKLRREGDVSDIAVKAAAYL